MRWLLQFLPASPVLPETLRLLLRLRERFELDLQLLPVRRM
jgi:hypothetical protein